MIDKQDNIDLYGLCMHLQTKQKAYLIITAFAVGFTFARTAAAGISLSASCTYRATGIPRSTVVVKGKGLRGKYYARVYSPAEDRWVDSKTTKTATEQGTVNFIFDSDPAVIARGASEITANYNQNKEVAGSIRNAETKARIGVVRADCAVR